jgi:hypothetical protein
MHVWHFLMPMFDAENDSKPLVWPIDVLAARGLAAIRLSRFTYRAHEIFHIEEESILHYAWSTSPLHSHICNHLEGRITGIYLCRRQRALLLCQFFLELQEEPQRRHPMCAFSPISAMRFFANYPNWYKWQL